MKVLKFRLVIKIDDFKSYSPHPTTEMTEEGVGPGIYDYVKRRIQDDRNFWSEEVERFPDRVVSNKGGVVSGSPRQQKARRRAGLL